MFFFLGCKSVQCMQLLLLKELLVSLKLPLLVVMCLLVFGFMVLIMVIVIATSQFSQVGKSEVEIVCAC